MIKLIDILKEILSDNAKKKALESFNISNLPQDQQKNIYDIFKTSYEKTTGASWDESKFMSRSRNWDFYGDEKGFITVRKQMSGYLKLVGVAGNPKSILTGLDELKSTGEPVWGLVSKDIQSLMHKKGFKTPNVIVLNILLRMIPKSVFGGVDYKVNLDGSITLDYEDVGKATKYFVGNDSYFNKIKKQIVDGTLDKVDGLSLTAIKTIKKLLESIELYEAMSDNAKKKALEKYKKEKPELGDGQINYYINKFSDRQASNVFQKKDIFQYKFDELEKLIDANFPSDVSTKKDDKEVDFKGSEDVVYNENKLLILLGDLKQKCIRYGKGYSWCISRPDASNMYFSYRMRLNEPVFYFVLDEDKPKEDKHHAMVIYINNNGEYYVANSLNEGDKKMSWSEIQTIQPKLKGLKNLFKHIPLTSEERNDYKRFKDPINDSKYDKLSFTDKEKYIGFAHDLSEEQIRNTPKQLVSKYAVTTTGNNIPKEIEKSLPPSDQKKLRDNRIEIMGYSAKFIYYQDDLTSDDLKVKGDLFLYRNTSLESLPAGLSVERDLSLYGCTSLKSLPAGLSVGSLNLGYCTSLKSLPDGLKVKGNLSLHVCTSLESLPAGLKVEGELDLGYCTSLESLPAGLKVKGNLILTGCTSLESLPAGLSVGEGLYLIDCTSLESLPAGLSVGRDLSLYGCTSLESLPAGLSVGSLNLGYCTSLESLPAGLKVKGNLSLEGCTSLKSLPAGLSVERGLTLTGCTSLESLPAGLSVGGELDLEGCTKLFKYTKEQIRQMVPKVVGDIYF